MQINRLHSWNLDYTEAVALQHKLAAGLTEKAIDVDAIQTIAGIDVSSTRHSSVIHAAVVVFDYDSLEIVCQESASVKVEFPYIPGLLSFREGPAVIEAVSKLTMVPDVFIFDGQGYAHPRRLGLAAHLGIWLKKPSIGCAKTRLVGKYTEPGAKRDSSSDLIDKTELIGTVLRTRENVKPVYVSRGHLSDLPSAKKIVLETAPRFRLPEPIRAAHTLSNKVRVEYNR